MLFSHPRSYAYLSCVGVLGWNVGEPATAELFVWLVAAPVTVPLSLFEITYAAVKDPGYSISIFGLSHRALIPLEYIGYCILFWTACWCVTRKRRRGDEEARRRRVGLCERCGYDLQGNVSGVCPECGLGFGRVQLQPT